MPVDVPLMTALVPSNIVLVPSDDEWLSCAVAFVSVVAALSVRVVSMDWDSCSNLPMTSRCTGNVGALIVAQ